jgi:hypothetical protein
MGPFFLGKNKLGGNMSFYYISNPYNGTDEEREARAKIASWVCGELIKRDIHAWSPIVHNHALMKTVEFTLDERRSLMLDYDFSLLRAARGMIVLEIVGWDRSFGVQAEIQLCRELRKPVKFLDPEDLKHHNDPNLIFRDQPKKEKEYESNLRRTQIQGLQAHIS